MPESHIIYVSGVHGSGKSTLIQALETDTTHFIHTRKFKIPKPEDVCERQLVRYCRFYLQQFHERTLAQNNPTKYVLVDRCWFDARAYTNGFAKMNWLTREEQSQMGNVTDFLFEQQPGAIVYLNSPITYIEQKLQERWAAKRKKWREDDFEYLSMVSESYQYLFPKLPCDKLEIRTTNLSERISTVRAWLGLQP